MGRRLKTKDSDIKDLVKARTLSSCQATVSQADNRDKNNTLTKAHESFQSWKAKESRSDKTTNGNQQLGKHDQPRSCTVQT